MNESHSKQINKKKYGILNIDMLSVNKYKQSFRYNCFRMYMEMNRFATYSMMNNNDTNAEKYVCLPRLEFVMI